MSDITAGITASTQSQLANAVSTAVMKQSLDAAKSQGQAVVSMLQDAAQMQQAITSTDPGKGQIIDVTA